jgi:hypothetical protein
MRQKRGQFFLLAAIILVSLLAGIFLYTNQVFLQDYRTGIKLLGSEVREETGVVIDYYVAKDDDKIEDFIFKMADSIKERKGPLDPPEMVFFYRIEDNISVYNLAKEDIKVDRGDGHEKTVSTKREEIRIAANVAGAGPSTVSKVNFKQDAETIPLTDFKDNTQNLIFHWNETVYKTPFIEKNNIYFVLKERVGDETHTIQA